ncbi:MAG: hypothetical protein J5819_00535 [Eubacterium sp.]|nr:hypothetical protein [Eubacterium sp.]
MKMRKRIPTITLLFAMLLSILPVKPSMAISKNQEAGEAFAEAISSGSIKFKGKDAIYSIGDADGDGIDDLLIQNKDKAIVYAYKSGKIKTILRVIPEYSLSYDSSKKVFWECGEGAGAWAIAHKLKKGKLVEKYRYFSDFDANDKAYYSYQKAGEKAKRISKSKFKKARTHAYKCEKHATKKELIEILNSLEGAASDEKPLSTYWSADSATAQSLREYVVSGTERTTTRAIVANSPIADYVTPNHIIGTEFEVKVKGYETVSSNMDFKYVDGDELVFTGGFIQKDLNACKTIWIEREIGQRPVLAFGNSGSDTSMLNYAIDKRNAYPTGAYMVVADDSEREWGMEDWEKKSADYIAQGYHPVSMKTEFAKIYPDGISKSETQVAAA